MVVLVYRVMILILWRPGAGGREAVTSCRRWRTCCGWPSPRQRRPCPADAPAARATACTCTRSAPRVRPLQAPFFPILLSICLLWPPSFYPAVQLQVLMKGLPSQLGIWPPGYCRCADQAWPIGLMHSFLELACGDQRYYIYIIFVDGGAVHACRRAGGANAVVLVL